MKYLIAICFALLAVAAAEDFKLRNEDDLNQARKECVEAKKVTPELIEKYKKFDFPEDEITRCYIECIIEKFDLFDPKNGFNVHNLIAQLNSPNSAEAKTEIEKCVDHNEQKSDTCTWAFRGFKCFISKNMSLVKQSLKND